MDVVKYEVGAPFPQPNDCPHVERCTTQIVGGSFDVLYYIKGASAADVKTFKDAFLRFHVMPVDDIPFMAISYAGSRWTYDFSLTVAARGELADAFLTDEANAVTLFLIDADTNKLRAARMVGLPPEAVRQIKDACRAQVERYGDAAEVLAVINRVYAGLSTEDIIKRGAVYEFKR